MEHQAIYNLYSNVKSIITSEDGSTTTAYDANDNEVTIDMSAVNAKATELQTAEDNKENQKATNKINGKQKLIDLGLTEDEVDIIYGDN